MKQSYIIAGVLALAAAGWVASGQVGQDARRQAARKPPADLTAIQTVPTVRVLRSIAQPRQTEVILRGRTEATRKVDIKAETYGRIIELKVETMDDGGTWRVSREAVFGQLGSSATR